MAGLNGKVTTASDSSIVTKDLDFDVLWYRASPTNGIQQVGIGDGSRCVYGMPDYDERVFNWSTKSWVGPTKLIVALHMEDTVWTDGTMNGRNCTTYRDGGLKLVGGYLRLRVWGRLASAHKSISLKGGNVDVSGLYSSLNAYHAGGYFATFAPGEGCGPAKWPTQQFRQAGFPPYAEWCEVTVKVPSDLS